MEYKIPYIPDFNISSFMLYFYNIIIISKMKLVHTSKNDLSSVFFGGPGVGAAGATETTSARSEKKS